MLDDRVAQQQLSSKDAPTNHILVENRFIENQISSIFN
jgi:hypothetical protein